MKRIVASNYQKYQKEQNFKTAKTRTEKPCRKFTFKTHQIAIRLESLLKLRQPVGLKNRSLSTMWNFYDKFS